MGPDTTEGEEIVDHDGDPDAGEVANRLDPDMPANARVASRPA